MAAGQREALEGSRRGPEFRAAIDAGIVLGRGPVPVSPTGATLEPPPRGSRLDPNHPQKGILKGEPTGIMGEPPVFCAPRAWVEDREAYTPDDSRYAERWPPQEARPQRLYLRGEGSLGADGARWTGASLSL